MKETETNKQKWNERNKLIFLQVAEIGVPNYWKLKRILNMEHFPHLRIIFQIAGAHGRISVL